MSERSRILQPPSDGGERPTRAPVVIVGGGQAGLSVGYHLSRLGVEFVILEGNRRVGDSWRQRWDSLRLFTPARFDGLDGMPYPAAAHTMPAKDEMARYLEAYAAHFRLPVETGTRVERVSRTEDRYRVEAGSRQWEARHVVVAMATFQEPRVPAFGGELGPGIAQLHSRDYRNLSQLRDGGVLIVGAGNSGAEIALETARGGHRTLLSGRHPGHLPFRIDGIAYRAGLVRLILRGAFHRVLTTGTPLGRRARPSIVAKGGPLIRVKPRDLEAAGVERVPRMEGVREGRPLLADGRMPEVANVIWCTGYRPGFSWIDLPVLDSDGEPVQRRGIVPGEPGLYFVGLHFLYALSSTMIHGVGRDAQHVARTIRGREAATGR